MGTAGAVAKLSLLVMTAWLAFEPGAAGASTIVATWTPGPGGFDDPTRWTFSTPPEAATFPNNDGLDSFSVSIDADALTASNVDLAVASTIDSLQVGAGDRLALASSLTVDASSLLPGSGTVRNDGVVEVGPNGLLAFVGDGVLEGGGELLVQAGSSPALRLTGSVASLTQEAGHTIRGGGTIDLNQSMLLTNRGSIGSSGPDMLSIAGDLSNSGELRVGDAGVLVEGELSNDSAGTIHIAAGSELEVLGGVVLRGGLLTLGSASRGVFSSFASSSGRVVLESGASLESAFKMSIGADVVLDEAKVESGFVIFVRGNGSIEGSGVVVPGAGRQLLVSSGGSIAPGGAGIGRIDVDGGFDLGRGGTMVSEVGGAGPDEFDRLVATGGALLLERDVLKVSLISGYQPLRGDAFELIEAASLRALSPLSRAIAVPDIGNGLFLVPDIETTAIGQNLVVAAKAQVTASWTPGSDGDYEDSTRWSFDQPLPEGSIRIPDEDGRSLYHARIDGDGGAASSVALSGHVRVESLTVGEHNVLAIADGALLEIRGGGGRPGAGVIANDGRIELEAAGGGAEIRAQAPLRFEGSGELVLSDHAGNRIGRAGGGRLTIENAAGHTIRGSGTIALGSGSNFGQDDSRTQLTNAGTIEADGDSALTIEGFVTNTGLLRATGSGGLTIKGRTSGSGGTIEVLPGSRLGTWRDLSSSRLSFDASEPSSIGGWLTVGELEVLNGSVVTASKWGGAIHARVAGGSNLIITPVNIWKIRGRFELDDGRLETERLRLDRGGRLEGKGIVSLTGSQANFEIRGGEIAPGGTGAGELVIETGAFELGVFGTLELGLGGTQSGAEYDVLTVLGTSVFDGTVLVEWIDAPNGQPFAAARGDSFDVLQSSFALSVPADLVLPELEMGLGWTASIVSSGGLDRLRLTIVPEPKTALLLGIGLVCLAAWSRPARRANARLPRHRQRLSPANR